MSACLPVVVHLAVSVVNPVSTAITFGWLSVCRSVRVCVCVGARSTVGLSVDRGRYSMPESGVRGLTVSRRPSWGSRRPGQKRRSEPPPLGVGGGVGPKVKCRVR